MGLEAAYRTAIAPEWIDYNGHLRDAYYGLIVSYAADALMDKLGMDDAYRKRTGYSLYTLEMYLRFFREVKETDIVAVAPKFLGADHKRLHVRFDLTCESHPETAATAELMLICVHQQADATRSKSFPTAIAAAIHELQQLTADILVASPGSRRIGLHPERVG